VFQTFFYFIFVFSLIYKGSSFFLVLRVFSDVGQTLGRHPVIVTAVLIPYPLENGQTKMVFSQIKLFLIVSSAIDNLFLEDAMEKNYELLRKQYPEIISINQFYKICHIAKRSAVYLLEHGIVPYTDTGKMTWKYQIALSDTIEYLKQRDVVGSIIPKGAVSNKRKYPRKRTKEPSMFRGHAQEDESELIKAYFEVAFADCSDVITPGEAADLLGFHINTIRNKIRKGHLQTLNSNNVYIIPKVYFIDYLGTTDFISTIGYSETFKRHLDGFRGWKESSYQKQRGESA